MSHTPSRSPKRKRSTPSPDRPAIPTPENGSLEYAYDEELPSELQTPRDDEDEVDGLRAKRPRWERPRRLNYFPHMTLHGHRRGVAGVRFSPDGEWIASCSADATLKIWSARTGALAHTLEGHLAGISALAWSPDSAVLASGADDKLIRLWDARTGACLPCSPLRGHHNYVYSLAFSPKGNILVSGSYDEAVFVWDVRTARLMRRLPAHSDPVSGVDFVRDGTLVASCASDGLIRIWDTATGQCLKTLVHEDNAPVTSVRFSPNGKFVLAATLDGCVRLWNYVEGRCVKTYQGHRNERFSIGTAFGTYRAEKQVIAAMKVKEGETGFSIEEGKEDVEESPTWAFAACGSEDGRVVLWDVSSKEILQELHGHTGVVLGVDVAPDGRTMATCGADRTIKIWRPGPLPVAPEDMNGHENVDKGDVGVPTTEAQALERNGSAGIQEQMLVAHEDG